jgi:hypothetical protein
MYLYLGRRDRKGARVVMVLDGPETHPVRITNLKSINLPDAVFNSVEKIVYDNRMYWEPWVESAESYEVLRQNLHKRGYSDLYPSCKPLYDGSSLLCPPVADMAKHPSKKTMVAKRS